LDGVEEKILNGMGAKTFSAKKIVYIDGINEMVIFHCIIALPCYFSCIGNAPIKDKVFVMFSKKIVNIGFAFGGIAVITE